MSLYVVSRRKVVYQQTGPGGAQVVYVPSADQIQVLKDAAGTAMVKAPVKGGANTGRGPQLYRVARGQRTIYGYLPQPILDLSETVKVWLAEDLVPPEADAFFYVFTPSVVIHGVRELTDEGKYAWRTAHLQLGDDNPLEALQVVMSDFRLSHPDKKVCLAVANDIKLYREMQLSTGSHGFTPVPFSTLKPQPKVAPLYTHLNFTWAFMLLLLLGGVGVVAMAGYWVMNLQQRSQIQSEIEATERQITSVQINPRVGHIRQPQAMLDEMKRVIDVPPSTLIAAAGDVGQTYGELSRIEFGGEQQPTEDIGLITGERFETVKLAINKPNDLLLIDQADHTSRLLADMPWVRQVIRSGQGGPESMDLLVVVQTSQTTPVGGQP